MADPVFVDEVTPLNAVNMNKLQTRDEKAVANGYPSLDGTGKVPLGQLPAIGGGADLSYDGDWVAGTYQDGDVVIDNGIAYLCVGGPTTVRPDVAPWGGAVANRPAPELAYAEMTADVLPTATTEATAQVCITAPPVTLDGSTAIVVEFFSALVAAAPTASAAIVFWLYDGAVSLGRIGYVQTPAALNMYVPARLARRLIPAAGTHTYSIRANVTSGTGVVQGGAGGPGLPVPAHIRVTQANPYYLAVPDPASPASIIVSGVGPWVAAAGSVGAGSGTAFTVDVPGTYLLTVGMTAYTATTLISTVQVYVDQVLVATANNGFTANVHCTLPAKSAKVALGAGAHRLALKCGTSVTSDSGDFMEATLMRTA